MKVYNIVMEHEIDEMKQELVGKDIVKMIKGMINSEKNIEVSTRKMMVENNMEILFET